MFICFLFESWMKYQYYSHVCELSMSKVKLLYQPTRWFCHSVISSHCVANFGSFECFKLFFFYPSLSAFFRGNIASVEIALMKKGLRIILTSTDNVFKKTERSVSFSIILGSGRNLRHILKPSQTNQNYL